MINDGINDVPENTIVVFDMPEMNYSDSHLLISRPNKKRDWFAPFYYKCLPLTIGNQYGFVFYSNTDISIIWNGENHPNNTIIKFLDPEYDTSRYPVLSSHFGRGVVTVVVPFALRTPPGVNLMSITPPNFITPNLTHLTGVVETDNLRFNFTFNIKVMSPNIETIIKKGDPLGAFIPIPRYFVDSFKIKTAKEIFDQEIINIENKAIVDQHYERVNVEYVSKDSTGGKYLDGIDVYGNSFKNHQTSIIK